jgi:MoaA/NifB/PqqE/SkfB family radical SAM enzyme
VLITNDGDVMPCSHASGAVGNLRDNSIEEIWNGPVMREVRASILKGEVHRVCGSSECPFQRVDPVFPERKEPLRIEGDFARAFDEEWYLREHPDVREAVARCRLTSGLEHFIRHGRVEGRAYRLAPGQPSLAPGGPDGPPPPAAVAGGGPCAAPERPVPNWLLGLLEYSQGATILRARPVDVVMVVSTICNLHCVMCPHGMDRVVRPHNTPTDVMEGLESFLETASRICVSGLGEPMSAPAFWWLIDRSALWGDRSFRVHSNGHLITPEGAERLLKSGVTEMSISLDAATPGTYARIRGGDLESALAGISALVRLRQGFPNKRMEVSINMTLMRENLGEAAAFIALGKGLGVDAVMFSQLFAFGDSPDWRVERDGWEFVYAEQMLGRAPAEARLHISKAKEFAEKVGMPVQFFSSVLDYLK